MAFLALMLATVVVGIIVSVLTAWPVMLLWNWLMPELFGLKLITFWQALGLSILCMILFKSTSSSSSSK